MPFTTFLILSLSKDARPSCSDQPRASCSKALISPLWRKQDWEDRMRLISYRQGAQTGVGVMVDDTSFVALPKVVHQLPHRLKALIAMEGGPEKAAEAAKGKKAD